MEAETQGEVARGVEGCRAEGGWAEEASRAGVGLQREGFELRQHRDARKGSGLSQDLQQERSQSNQGWVSPIKGWKKPPCLL